MIINNTINNYLKSGLISIFFSHSDMCYKMLPKNNKSPNGQVNAFNTVSIIIIMVINLDGPDSPRGASNILTRKLNSLLPNGRGYVHNFD